MNKILKMNKEKKLLVSAIKNGTVIDHIPAKNLFKVIKILGLENVEKPVTFGTNLTSRKIGKKAVIKISDVYFADKDLNKIALISEKVRLNVIKNYEVIEKKQVKIPERVVGIAKCVNPKCITNHENITTKFIVINKEGIAIKCEYCEKITTKKHIKILK